MFLIVTADTLAVNGLQAWEVPDASELSSIGEDNYFRENSLEARQIKGISYACG